MLRSASSPMKVGIQIVVGIFRPNKERCAQVLQKRLGYVYFNYCYEWGNCQEIQSFSLNPIFCCQSRHRYKVGLKVFVVNSEFLKDPYSSKSSCLHQSTNLVDLKQVLVIVFRWLRDQLLKWLMGPYSLVILIKWNPAWHLSDHKWQGMMERITYRRALPQTSDLIKHLVDYVYLNALANQDLWVPTRTYFYLDLQWN